MEHNPWITHDTTVPYENQWIRLEHSAVTTPGGSAGVYGVVRFKNRAVGVVPIDDEDHTWLVGQYRYALDVYSWEIPAGGCPEGESLATTAHRELLEETGLEASVLTPLLSGIHLTNSVTDETAWAFVARGLTQREAEPDDTEELAVRRLPVSEALDMVLDGRITDAFTIMALLRIHAGRTGSITP